MNSNLRKAARSIILLSLLFTLAFVLSSASASRAAGTRSPSPAKVAQLNAASTSLQGNNLSTNLFQDNPPGVDPELVRRLRQSARGPVSISARQSTGFASFVRAGKDGDLLPGNQGRVPQGKATGFFAQFGGLFGVRNAREELVLVSSVADPLGATHLTYQQVYKGVPVFAGALRAHLDAKGSLTAINGAFVPDVVLDTTPGLGADEAASRAIGDVLANPPGQREETDAPAPQAPTDLAVESNTLYVYRDGLIQNVAGPNRLVYEVVVTGDGLREFVYVDAHSGKIVNRYSAIEDALFRRLFERVYDPAALVWQEGDPFPGTLNQDQQNIVTFSGHSYNFFFNVFGRDSYDGAGHVMESVNNDPRIACPNANWNGTTTNYCNGVTADDVVAHEWGHAYTQFTHDLIYQWQPGALNESYSDIWGEVVDMLNGSGTDSPAPVRSDDGCSTHTTPIPLLTIHSPASIAGDYAAGGASFGPPLSNPGITGNVVLANDGAGVTSDACTALVNGAAIAGNIALVDRGTCAFTIKVKNAQLAGATGVIVADNVPGPVAGMAGTDPTITIPSLRVTLATGNLIKAELANTVNATLHVRGGAVVEDSYRWLIGEDATAFGGAIRDMWTPTCLADPGKVTDDEYFCATSDAGGVHTNSGIPNHGFALLVDGGTYNGHTVAAIGPVKAAHLYWRAQSVYQTRITDFAGHADALEASCQDLIGVPLEGLSTNGPAGPSGEAITAADCSAVSEMIAAVELRTDPSAQCNFQPLLQPNPPAVCASGSPITIFKEKFNSLDEWTLSNQGVFSGWPGFDWAESRELPAGRSGSAAFATDPVAGNCDAGAGDISGVMSMVSRPIKIVPGLQVVPRLVFQHYVATEPGWDGGNLKISINGGPFTLVPASAFTFNPYNTTLQTTAAGNTNPLQGQPAFSGTDGGKVTGSWGESQIDLALLGVKVGDFIRLRFDFGMDGCNGNDGWYLDEIELVACKP